MAAESLTSQTCPTLHPSECYKSNLIKIDDNIFTFTTWKGVYTFNTEKINGLNSKLIYQVRARPNST